VPQRQTLAAMAKICRLLQLTKKKRQFISNLEMNCRFLMIYIIELTTYINFSLSKIIIFSFFN